VISLVVLLISASNPPTSQTTFSDFTSNPLVDVVIGGMIAAFASLITVSLTNRQQFKRDNQAYQQQIEREKAAYARSLKDAKRERLRNSYKVLLNAADKYQYEIQQITHIPSEANIALIGVDDAMTEIYLEDIDNDVVKFFYELRGAFHAHDAHLNTPSEGTWAEVMNHKRAVPQKYEQLKAAMNKHLKELES
jgi:hypothetical protein